MKSNRARLLMILLITIIAWMTYIGLCEVDRAYLQSVVDEGKTLSYGFLGMDTFLTKLESDDFYSADQCLTPDSDCRTTIDRLGRIAFEMSDTKFASPVCEDQTISCMIRHVRLFSDKEKPRLLVERSWYLDELFYIVLFTAYVAGLIGIAYCITRKRTADSLAVH